MTNARQGWNAAQRASERPLPKPRKVHGPVGEWLDPDDASALSWPHKRRVVAEYAGELPLKFACCAGCGFHVCSCKPVESFFKNLRTFSASEPCKLTPAQAEAFFRPFDSRHMATVDGYPRVPPKNLCCDVVGDHSTGCRFHPVNVARLYPLIADLTRHMRDHQEAYAKPDDAVRVGSFDSPLTIAEAEKVAALWNKPEPREYNLPAFSLETAADVEKLRQAAALKLYEAYWSLPIG